MPSTGGFQSSMNTFIIQDVKIFDGHKFIADGFAYVRDGQIAEVGSGEPDELIGKYTLRISRPQHTLIPGLIDAHIHAISGDTDSVEPTLRFGVTTMVAEPQNKARYSDYKYAGKGAVVEGGWPILVLKKELESVPQGEEILDAIISAWPRIRTSNDAKPFARQQVNQYGASYIKVFHELEHTLAMKLPAPSIAVQSVMTIAAHDAGVIAVGHALSYSGAMDILEAGVDGLTHISSTNLSTTTSSGL
ncbi:hypothetical protein FLAG1_09918 [Fusarium langsethiae]|uniref:Amidohydrolase-related domain-containing protein n=1 Tax=Fusarium langsethiae TaxID=179993 RepID=A0A0N0DBU2_FUSLA|nr:hypothetical protein FLAG1_09918 [Fusarium langsethiae]GKU06294.1 unnamed protein product [Fusarium langsethiae]GKU14933.1 unnamed protein product [Fusarium langsethiae]